MFKNQIVIFIAALLMAFFASNFFFSEKSKEISCGYPFTPPPVQQIIGLPDGRYLCLSQDGSRIYEYESSGKMLAEIDFVAGPNDFFRAVSILYGASSNIVQLMSSHGVIRDFQLPALPSVGSSAIPSFSNTEPVTINIENPGNSNEPSSVEPSQAGS